MDTVRCYESERNYSKNLLRIPILMPITPTAYLLPFRVAAYFWTASLMQVSYLKSYPFSPLLELIFMKILVENMREAKQKLVFIFEQHQISSFQLCTKMILQNFVRILLLFHHEYSNYTTIKIKRITLMRKTEIKHYSLDVFTNMNTLKAPKRLMFYFFFIVV